MTDREMTEKVCDHFEDRTTNELFKFLAILLASALTLQPEEDREPMLETFGMNVMSFIEQADDFEEKKGS